MKYPPQLVYDEKEKIWSCPEQRLHFSNDLSIGELIFKELQRHAKDVAQISATEHTKLTRGELLLNAKRVSSYMRQLGLQQTDIVGIMARNTTHISAVAFACFFNGIPFHSLNVEYEQSTIENLFQITKPKLIFCDGDDYGKVSAATKELNVTIITMRNHISGVVSITDILGTKVPENFAPLRLKDGNKQTLCILCSSGTTGTPKAVTLSNCHRFEIMPELTTADVQYSYSTLDWFTGVLTLILNGLFSTLRIITDKPFDPVFVLRLLEEFKVTWLLQTPSHMAMLVNCPEFEKTNLDNMRYFYYGGGRCSIKVLHAMRKRLQNGSLRNVYGITELGPATMNKHFDEKPDSMGSLVPGTKCKILDPQGEVLGPNQMGEICFFNGLHWAGYYGNPEETRNIRDEQHWVHTGDMGCVDNEGFIFLVDRKKEMLKYQNIMYYPSEIEEIIASMPEVSEVCVFGILNEFVGDEAAAAVVKKHGVQLTSQDVIDYVKNNVTTKYKQLNAGAIIVDELLRLPNGKTNRRANKEHFLEMLAKGEKLK